MLRVRAYSKWIPIRGYVLSEADRVYFQDLQEKRWYGWKTIDTEVVPTPVKISMAAFGDTGCGWTSKFAKYGTFGRDGVIR